MTDSVPMASINLFKSSL